MLTSFVKRETFLAQLFLWNTPLDVALLIVEIAFVNAHCAAALSLFATATSTLLIAVLTADLIDLFLAAFVLVTKILFFADLIFAISYTSNSDFGSCMFAVTQKQTRAFLRNMLVYNITNL